jgi:predicted RecA/RadA family phage recombinase
MSRRYASVLAVGALLAVVLTGCLATEEGTGGEEVTEVPAPDAGQMPEGEVPGADDAGVVTTEDGDNLLSALRGDDGDTERLSAYVNQDLEGERVLVQHVVSDLGFWVGEDEQRRIFVHLGPDMTASESTVAVGDRIDFAGFLEENAVEDSVDHHDLADDDGGPLHRAQGHHVELTALVVAED